MARGQESALNKCEINKFFVWMKPMCIKNSIQFLLRNNVYGMADNKCKCDKKYFFIVVEKFVVFETKHKSVIFFYPLLWRE